MPRSLWISKGFFKQLNKAQFGKHFYTSIKAHSLFFFLIPLLITPEQPSKFKRRQQ